ncbi:DUF6265 family protein [Pseudoduganella sp. OTU4001]|uniref:DUF6265 family protein n=1 Tax=Pseudoduganella sp. OTU4001 TaxID=3043854 RepID=UPI00313C868A
MRKQFLCALLLASAGAIAHDAPLDKLAWLAGCWTHTNAEAGSMEMWSLPAGGTMLGVARTVKNGKTVEWEHTMIRETAPGVWSYVAKPSRQPEASFAVKSIGDGEVVFENPQHDFPQRIIYKRDGADGLKARIEGESKGKQKAFDYPMKRTQCPAGG